MHARMHAHEGRNACYAAVGLIHCAGRVALHQLCCGGLLATGWREQHKRTSV